jgi:hypothetical protein
VKNLRSRLSFSNVVAVLALFIALGGSAYAATQLKKNSVGTKQLKKNAVNGSKVKDQSLTGKDINLAKLGTVPAATNATSATTAGTASALTPPEAIHLVGAPGEPAFQSGSQNALAPGLSLQPVGFYRDHEGIVHFEGVATMGGTGLGAIFELPPGFRPANGTIQAFPNLEEKIVFVGGSNTVEGSTNLSGEVLPTGEAGKAVVLSGITFRAAS